MFFAQILKKKTDYVLQCELIRHKPIVWIINENIYFWKVNDRKLQLQSSLPKTSRKTKVYVNSIDDWSRLLSNNCLITIAFVQGHNTESKFHDNYLAEFRDLFSLFFMWLLALNGLPPHNIEDRRKVPYINHRAKVETTVQRFFWCEYLNLRLLCAKIRFDVMSLVVDSCGNTVRRRFLAAVASAFNFLSSSLLRLDRLNYVAEILLSPEWRWKHRFVHKATNIFLSRPIYYL